MFAGALVAAHDALDVGGLLLVGLRAAALRAVGLRAGRRALLHHVAAIQIRADDRVGAVRRQRRRRRGRCVRAVHGRQTVGRLQAAQARRQLRHVLDLGRQHRRQVRGHGVAPRARRLMADGQRHRAREVELERAQVAGVAWIEEAGRRRR